LKTFYRILWKYADGITQDSELAKQKAKVYLPENVVNETIEIGVDFNVFNPSIEKGSIRKKYNLGGRPIIFHSRSIAKIYNLDTIIRSIPIVREQVSKICYLFTGDFESLNQGSKKYIIDHNLHNNVIFCGRLDHETEMKFYYADADITVSVPSSDSSPFSVYEAMATKTPVIVSDLPWLDGKFTHGKHLLTVPVQNELALAAAIINLINNEVILDVESAYSIVFDKINMLVENERLGLLFEKSILTKKN
jgi:glycosyltransferase involved in cell wall biosynthesis